MIRSESEGRDSESSSDFSGSVLRSRTLGDTLLLAARAAATDNARTLFGAAIRHVLDILVGRSDFWCFAHFGAPVGGVGLLKDGPQSAIRLHACREIIASVSISKQSPLASSQGGTAVQSGVASGPNQNRN